MSPLPFKPKPVPSYAPVEATAPKTPWYLRARIYQLVTILALFAAARGH